MELTRGIHPDTLAALSGDYFYYIWMVEVDWPSGVVRAHSGTGTVSYNNQSWYGVGNFGKISLPDESMGMASFPAEFEIVGLPDDMSAYLDEEIRNRSIQVYGAVVTERAGNSIVGAPFEVWSGYVDAMTFHADVSGSDGSLEYGLRLSARGGPTARTSAEIYHTPEDQESKFPGDTAGRLTINAEAEAAKMSWPES